MPGLFGIITKDRGLSGHSLLEMGRRMAYSMRHKPWLRVEILGDEEFCAGRAHLGVQNTDPQPLVGKGGLVRAWFDGDYYRNATSTESATPSADEIWNLVVDPIAGITSVDGIFNLAFYDQEMRELTLANDRLGLRPLYYSETRDWFAYASEVKALLAIHDRLPELDEISLYQYFGFDHMLAERTWWKGIELLPPASLWRISAKGCTKRQYWTFEKIRRDFGDPIELQVKFGQLWSQDVRRHSKAGTMPLLLSGGLDSRLLLAELLEQEADIQAITFGSEESAEMEPARQVAMLAGVPHHPAYLSTANWWHRREEAIWQTDGLVNGNHLHSAITMDEVRIGACYSPINIAGDLLFGGSHLHKEALTDWVLSLDKFLGARYMPNPFFDKEEVLLASSEDAARYAHGPSSDCFHISQRLRRYAVYSPLALSSHCEIAFPGLSHALLNLMLGELSNEDRLDHKFYNRFLASKYPKYFGNLPWQVTGRGLAESFPTRLSRKSREIISAIGTSCYQIISLPRIRRLRRIALVDSAIRSGKPGLELLLNIRGRGYPSDQWFVNYPECIRVNKVREKLLSTELLADTYLKGRARAVLSNPQDPRLNASSIIAVLTFETYLRQVAGGIGPANQFLPASMPDLISQTAKQF